MYALGARGELRCLDAATGKLVWRKNILQDTGANNLRWGMSGSPLVVGDAVIVLPGGPGGQSVAAYDRLTGKRLWTALDDKTAYASPMQVTLLGVPQYLVVSATRLVGLSLDRSRRALGVSLEHRARCQRGAADRDQRQPHLLLVGIRRRRGACSS